MSAYSQVELKDLKIAAQIGTYGPGDVMPEAHLLDLTLIIAPDLVLIAQDGIAHVFDYDPLIRQIDALTRERHYETQERLITRIAYACAAYPVIKALDNVFALRVVEKLDIVEHVMAGFFAGFILSPADAFAFDQVEEAFRHRIIPTVASAAHALCQIVLFEELLPLVAGEL